MVTYLHKEKYFAEHRADDRFLIAEVIQSCKPNVFVELGSRIGGMTAFFADTVRPWGGHVYGFDIENQLHEDLLGEYPNVSFYEEDVLADNPRILSLIRRTNVALYCDNGNKEQEVCIYAPHMPVGSLLGCHDYGSEVHPEIVEPVLQRLGYAKCRHEDFEALVTPTYPISMTRFWRRERFL